MPSNQQSPFARVDIAADQQSSASPVLDHVSHRRGTAGAGSTQGRLRSGRHDAVAVLDSSARSAAQLDSNDNEHARPSLLQWQTFDAEVCSAWQQA